MRNKNLHSLKKSSRKGQGKNNEKREQLIKYIEESPYIELKEQPSIANSFGLSYSKSLFASVYRKRAYDYLWEHIATAAMVSKATKIPINYMTQIKAYYEDKGLLKVIYLGKCPTSPKSVNVQFLSTNPKNWNNPDVIPKSNQLKFNLFEK